MAVADWPATLPQAGSLGGSGEVQANVVVFEPEVGPTIDRRRASMVQRTHDVELAALSPAEYQTFLDFFTDTIYSGVLPFNWVNPMTGTAHKVKIVQRQGQPAFREERVTPSVIKINFQITLVR